MTLKYKIEGKKIFMVDFAFFSRRFFTGLILFLSLFSVMWGCSKKAEDAPVNADTSATPGPSAPASACGDGIVDPSKGEQCEGGNCCDENCHFKGEGLACNDGRDETVNDHCDLSGSCVGSLCGNGVCDASETHATCPEECPICVRDRHCDAAAGENATNCPADCVVVEVRVLEEPVMTSAGPCGIWVSPSGEISTATGEFDHPFPQLSTALLFGRRDNKVICMMDGIYRIGINTITMARGDRVFGSFTNIGGVIRRADNFSTLRTSVIMNAGTTTVLRIAPGSGPETVLDGVMITQDVRDHNFYFVGTPLVHIESSSPTFRNNTLVMPPVTDLSIRERSVDRVGILVASEFGDAKPLIENNRIVMGENPVPYGANTAISLRDDNRYRLAPIIQGNDIQVGRAGILTAGVMGYSEGQETEAQRLPFRDASDGHALIKKNHILFQETTQVETRVDDRLSKIGGVSVGIALGVYLRPYLELSAPQEVGHRTPLQEKYYFATNIEANDIKGNFSQPSQSSYGLYLVHGQIVGSSTKIINNILQAGFPRTFAAGMYSQTTPLNMIHNTFSGYGVSLRRSAGEPLPDARSCSVYLDRSDNFTMVDMKNNILTSQSGSSDYDRVGLCLTGNFPFDNPVKGNLFDAAQLNLAYAQLGGHNLRWTYDQLLSYVEAGRMTNTWGRPLPFRDNLNANPRFVDLPHGVLNLSPTSPAVDAVTCSGEVTEDIQGDERPTMASDLPRPLGQICDPGADEYIPPGLIVRP